MQQVLPLVSDHDHRREETALAAFTKRGAEPRPTFALLLVSIVVAAWAMSIDLVERYSTGAFVAGLGGAAACALAIGLVLERVKSSAARTFFILALPTACGAALGVMIQIAVLAKVGHEWSRAVQDLGGLIDTLHPLGWVLGGVVLGGVPALVVSVFLLLAARALSRLAGHDAAEGFGVGYVGCIGLLAAVGLFCVHGLAFAPLLGVAGAASVAVLVSRLIDGSRLAFLRRVYARKGHDFDVVPAAQFAHDPTLAPMIAAAGGGAVLVRLARGEYRAQAMQPIALVADSEAETLRPLLRRRRIAAVALFATVGASLLALDLKL